MRPRQIKVVRPSERQTLTDPFVTCSFKNSHGDGEVLRRGEGQGADLEVMYRVPAQASLDQNTVDVQVERAAFLDNAMRYQASLRFLSSRLSGLLNAFRGE